MNMIRVIELDEVCIDKIYHVSPKIKPLAEKATVSLSIRSSREKG